MYGPQRTRRGLIIALVLGLLVFIYSIWSLRNTPLFAYFPIVGSLAQSATATPLPPTAAPPPTRTVLNQDEIIQLIQSYNAADELANSTNDLSHVLPYINPTGPLYERLKPEYERRRMANEAHNAQILRFFATTAIVSLDEITIDTQEIWDETAYNNLTNEILWAHAGVSTQQHYTIRRDTVSNWRIWDIQVTETSQP